MTELRTFHHVGWLREYGSWIPDGATVTVVRFMPRRRVVIEYQGRRCTTMLATLKKVANRETAMMCDGSERVETRHRVSTDVTPIRIEGDRARVEFARFDLVAYAVFLRCKALPESDIAYDWECDRYDLTTPVRFAALLGKRTERQARAKLPIAGHLFDYQRHIVESALSAQRYAVWADTGLGKTSIFLEWGRQVMRQSDGKVLILSPLQVIEQTRAEAQRWYGNGLRVERISTREDLAQWCTEPDPAMGITNYEKMIPGVLPELRSLAGLVADESSILKTGGGVIKWNLIKSARGIKYKLSCTATPAPNDTMEFASQAAFLEKLRTEADILWTYFTRDKRGAWRVKPHAREAFYGFMAAWSIYLRDPARYGWKDILASLPPAQYIEHEVPMTSEQRKLMWQLRSAAGSGLFGSKRTGVKERAKLSQLAKGFLYEDGRVARIDSLKPAKVAELVTEEVEAGRAVLVWTVFDEESRILAERLSGIGPAVLEGSMSAETRQKAIDAFRSGDAPVLITKAQLAGYGLNFQHCRAMVFSGFDDSFERMYQAVRRAYRFGQTETVRVHIPVVPELEGMIFENVQAKQARFERDAAEQERHYIAAMGKGAA